MKRLTIPDPPIDSKQLCQHTQGVIDQMNHEASPCASYGKDISLCAALVETLIQQHQHSLRAYAFRLLGADEAAQDIVQDTWIALYLQVQQQSSSWAEHANIAAWLRSVVKIKSSTIKKSGDVSVLSILKSPRASLSSTFQHLIIQKTPPFERMFIIPYTRQ